MNSEGKLAVPDLVAAIVGYRAWRLAVFQADDKPPQLRVLALHAKHSQALWSPEAPLAIPCRSRDCPALANDLSVKEVLESHSDYNCKCGYHAWKLPADNGSYLDEASLASDDLAIVSGQAQLWGVVCEHERGWRAERALPSLLDEVRWSSKLKPELRVAILAELERQYPQLVIAASVKDSSRKRRRWWRQAWKATRLFERIGVALIILGLVAHVLPAPLWQLLAVAIPLGILTLAIAVGERSR